MINYHDFIWCLSLYLIQRPRIWCGQTLQVMISSGSFIQMKWIYGGLMFSCKFAFARKWSEPISFVIWSMGKSIINYIFSENCKKRKCTSSTRDIPK